MTVWWFTHLSSNRDAGDDVMWSVVNELVCVFKERLQDVNEDQNLAGCPSSLSKHSRAAVISIHSTVLSINHHKADMWPTSVWACIIYELLTVTCDGVTPPCDMHFTIQMCCNRKKEQEEQHVFIWSWMQATVSGLGAGRALGVMGGLPFHVLDFPWRLIGYFTLWFDCQSCQKVNW